MKRNQIILIGVAAVIIIGIMIFSLVFFQKGTPGSSSTVQPPTGEQANITGRPGSSENSESGGETIQATPTVSLQNPQQVVSAFYAWYITYKGNALANGAYKDSPFLTQEYKEIIAALYSEDTHADPIICDAYKNYDVVIQNPTYSSILPQATVMITENGFNDMPLQRVTLQKTNGNWLISDIDCEP